MMMLCLPDSLQNEWQGMAADDFIGDQSDGGQPAEGTASRPIRGQYECHAITLDQSEAREGTLEAASYI